MMFKKLQATLALFFLAISCFSQVETRYFTNDEALRNCELIQRFNIEENSKGVRVFNVPSVDIKKLISEDEENKKQKKPYRFGCGVDVSCTLDNGKWISIEGGRLWIIEFKSEDARSLNLKFDGLYLPQGAELYVINHDKTELFGPVRQELIPASGSFLTETLDGSSATVYLYEPDNQYGRSKLHIKRVIYGYRDASRQSGNKQTRGFGDCSIDVACYPEYDKESKGVARMIINEDRTSYYGTGALLMATDYQYKPYFLTALHCIDHDDNGILSEEEKEELSDALFRFNYMKEECGGNLYKITRTIFGATVKAVITYKDCALLELNQDVKNYNNICWLGWDRSNSNPTSGVGLHHPHGEVMEIALEYSPIPIVLDLYTFYYDDGAVWLGSSGSPLLNQDKRVVGLLSWSANEATNVCNQPFARYNRVYSSWNGTGTDSTRLSTWLDPLGTGQTTINSSYPFEGYEIIGNELLASSNDYYVANLKSTHSVTWFITDSIYNQNCLQPNTPTTNQCRITRHSSHQMANATLVARIWYGSTLLKTLTKTISAYPGFYGTYNEEPIDYPLICAQPGSFGNLYSPYLKGATVTFSGNTIPTIWSHHTTTGYLSMRIPSTNGSFNVKIECTNGEEYNLHFVISNYSPYLFIEMNEGGMNVELSKEQNDEEMASKANPELKECTWTLEVYKASTGEKVYMQEARGSSCSIKITGWASGIYIVRAIIGDKVISEKSIVK